MVPIRLDQLNLGVTFDDGGDPVYAVVSDPDGNGVGVMSPVDPGRRSTT